MADSSNKTGSGDRRTFLKVGAGVVGGLVVGGVAAYAAKGSTVTTTTETEVSTSTAVSTATTTATLPAVTSTVTSTPPPVTSTVTSTTTSTNTTAITSMQAQLDTTTGFLTLNVGEQSELLAICAAIVPTDSSGPGANEAGCAYFIDHQLKGVYGNNGNVYRAGPYIPANTTGPITVGAYSYSSSTVNVTVAGKPYSITYPTTGNVRVGAGTRYQYAWTMRDFWRLGLAGVEAYANAAYGGNFEKLSAANQTQCLTDLWNNKPTAAQFGDILPSDFAYELFFMTWAGFTMDPVYGGNKNMVGWTYTGFNGANMGNFYGEGYVTTSIMVMTSPVTLGPASIGQFQKGSS